jgi:hypothetical protein
MTKMIISSASKSASKADLRLITASGMRTDRWTECGMRKFLENFFFIFFFFHRGDYGRATWRILSVGKKKKKSKNRNPKKKKKIRNFLGKFDKPILFIYGEKDFRSGEKNFKKFAAKTVEFFCLPGADHGLLMSKKFLPPFTEKCKQFIDQVYQNEKNVENSEENSGEKKKQEEISLEE